jgi:hypothetical protein
MKNSFKPFVFVIAHLGLPQQVWNSIDETWGKFQDRHYELWENEDGRRKLEMGVGLDFVVPEKTSPWEMVQFKVLLDQEFGDTRFIELAMSYCNIPIKEITWEALYCVWKENTDSFYTQVQEAMEADMTEKEKYWGPLPTVEYLGALYCVEIDPGSYSASLVTTPERHNVHEPTRSDVLDLFKQMYDVPKMMREARIEQAIIDAGGLEAYYHGEDPDVADEEPCDPYELCSSECNNMYLEQLSAEQDWKDTQPDAILAPPMDEHMWEYINEQKAVGGPCTDEPDCCCHRCEEAAMSQTLYVGPPVNEIAPCPPDFHEDLCICYNGYVRWNPQDNEAFWDSALYDNSRWDLHECPWQHSLPMGSYCDIEASKIAYRNWLVKTQPMFGPNLPSVVWRYEDWRVRLPQAEWPNTPIFSKLTETAIDDWMCDHADIVTEENVCDYWTYKELPF